MNYTLLGTQIRIKRKERGYTLKQLAEKLNVSTTYIGQIERAKGIPSLETLVKIANTLGVSVDSLVFGDLTGQSGNSYFLLKTNELTKDFSIAEKELLLQCIELFKNFKTS